MERNSKHVWIVIEDRLGAISMVYVPINRRNAGDVVDFTSILDADCNIVEYAEAEPCIRLSMMAGWAYERLPIVNLTIQNRVYQSKHPTGR